MSLANISLALVSVAFALGAFEVGLRLTHFSYPNFLMYDDDTGFRLRPGAEGWYTEEGRAYIKINRDGLRDREHEKLKPDNTVRIAVLGDSYAEALQIPMENTFWAILEGRLRTCLAFGNKSVEIINFGVSGYSTTQELLALRSRVWDFQPDIVLLAFLTGNDVRDNSRAISSGLSGMPPRPFFVYEHGKLILDRSFLVSPDLS